MKKIYFILSLVLIASISVKATTYSDSTKVIPGHKNLIKINVPALALRTYALEFERGITKKTALSLGFRFMPKGAIPFKDQINDIIDDPETSKQLNLFQFGNTAITPQIKFYFGKDLFKGFYLAPFARFATYKAEGTFLFDVNGTEEAMPLTGDLSTVTGGLEIGVQFRLGKAVHLNFNFGPQFGTSKGDFTGTKTLSPEEQQELRDELENLDIPFTDKTVTVNGSGANVKLDGPWGGLKGGIMLGIRF
jgi:hypothetical protein